MKFLIFSDPLFQKHRVEVPHPESPTRLATTEKWIKAKSIENIDVRFAGRVATDEELRSIHTERLISQIAQTAQEPLTWIDTDTFVTKDSAWVARNAVGTCLDAVDAACQKSRPRAFALVRPPGHHAEADRAMGFCLFNNVALAAAYAKQKHGIERVAIYDFDLHHGNGTQKIFYSSPEVLYLSHHQHPFYPGTGDLNEIGTGEGTGRNVNSPLPQGSGDSVVLNLWDAIYRPILEQHSPELLFVSAGFDAHEKDPLGNLCITDRGFLELARRIEAFATAKKISVIYLLEGGYNPEAVSDGVRSIIQAHLKPSRPAAAPAKTPTTISLLEETKKTFQPYWKF